MKPPAEFVELAQCFYPGSRKKEMTLQDWIAGVLEWKTSTQRLASKHYLTELLASSASEADLKKIWDSTDPTYGFTKGMRHFLEILRDAL